MITELKKIGGNIVKVSYGVIEQVALRSMASKTTACESLVSTSKLLNLYRSSFHALHNLLLL